MFSVVATIATPFWSFLHVRLCCSGRFPHNQRCLHHILHRLTPFDGTCKRPILNTGKSAPPRKLKIQSRWNHHILPYGTVGLKISAGGKCFGYSGDTKYDETINTVLKREELTAAWFAPCDLVFHEIEFNNPSSVHAHWKQVESLQRAISG